MKKKVTFKRTAMRSDGVTPYYQVTFGNYMEVLPDGTKVWHAGESIFVSAAEYALINVGDELMFANKAAA
jgi:hypothetical protein